MSAFVTIFPLTSLTEGALVVPVSALADGPVVGADAHAPVLAGVTPLARVSTRVCYARCLKQRKLDFKLMLNKLLNLKFKNPTRR